MKYYVVSDIHGFYGALVQILRSVGFFDDPKPRKLIVVGDALDRGGEAREVARFLLDLKREDRLIYVLGNHEELLSACLQEIARGNAYAIASGMSHHYTNGTFDTVLQLAEMTAQEAVACPEEAVKRVMRSPFYRELLPSAVDFFETPHYIFTHGWLPCAVSGYPPNADYGYLPDWRDADHNRWKAARWFNGMLLACEHGITEEGKTIVCGHWHTSFGHAKYEKKGPEFGSGADFSPFQAQGILAMDACTAYSGIVNCVVLED